jgi:hypothetical protein
LDYKAIFKIALLLISSPARAWEEIRLEEDRRTVFTSFVYPLLGLCALAVFLGALIQVGWSGATAFQYAMTHCCAVTVALFGGYFFAAYLLNELCVRWLGKESDLPLMQQFAGYAMVVIFLLGIVTGFFPSFRMLSFLLCFYTLYPVWEGAGVLLHIEEKQRLNFSVIATLALVVCPIVIQILFNSLTSALN